MASPGPSKAKGKSRAEPRETDPLLSSPSRSDELAIEIPHQRSHRACGVLLTTMIVIASLVLSAALFLALLAFSFKPSESELDLLPRTAFSYAGPDDVHVLNVTDDGILLKISLRCGIDVDNALGLSRAYDLGKDESDLHGMRGRGAQWWESLRRRTAHAILDQLPAQNIHIKLLDPLVVFTGHSERIPLLSLDVLDDLKIPLIRDVDPRAPWLKPLTFVALAKPIATTGQLWEFIQHAWIAGEARIVINIHRAQGRIAQGVWWTKYARAQKEDLVFDAGLPVPRLPGLPRPGQRLDLSQLVHLEDYSFSTATPNALTITANASIPNPAGNITAVVPFSVPFAISLADGTSMAEVLTSPIIIRPQPRIEATISGRITANLSDDAGRDSPLSKFLQNYLHGFDNPITVRGLSQLPLHSHTDQPPPAWLLAGLPSLALNLKFPGPKPPPRIIQSVTIEHMRLTERAGKMRASGVVVAEIELPPGMQSVTANVVKVLPDVLVYDGPAGDEEADPDDPPPRAFGHILPDDFLDSTTEPSADPEYPYRIVVRAPLQDVPLNVLPGRDSVLSNFVSKIVFRGGAQAGVKGTASVRVEIVGVQGQVGLNDLPVKGEVWIGRQRG